MKRLIFPSCGLMVVLAGCGSTATAVTHSQPLSRPPLTRTIGTGFWEDMRIVAEEAKPVSLYLSDGASVQTIAVERNASFDLKVLLTDRYRGVPIAYASVTATVADNRRTVFRGRLEPTLPGNGISDYESDVSLPKPGRYKLTLAIGSPDQARHVEYRHVWALGQIHRMVSTFSWK